MGHIPHFIERIQVLTYFPPPQFYQPFLDYVRTKHAAVITFMQVLPASVLWWFCDTGIIDLRVNSVDTNH